MRVNYNGQTKNSIVRNLTSLEVSFDEENYSYRYAITSRLEMPREIADEFFGEHQTIEYQDVLPDGIFDFYPPNGSKKWQWLLHQVNNSWYKFPLHHHNIYNELPIKTDQQIVFAFESGDEGNPVITLDKETASNTYFTLCTWAFDLHFFYDIKKAYELNYQLDRCLIRNHRIRHAILDHYFDVLLSR